MEAVLLLACIARRFRLVLDPACRLVPFPSITLRAAHGVRMTIHEPAETGATPKPAGVGWQPSAVSIQPPAVRPEI